MLSETTPSDSRAPLAGRHSVYELKERVGRGGSGDVYRALDLHTGREVAIKQIIRPISRAVEASVQQSGAYQDPGDDSPLGIGMDTLDPTLQSWLTEVEALIQLTTGPHPCAFITPYLDHMAIRVRHHNVLMLVEPFASRGSIAKHLRAASCGLLEDDAMPVIHQVTLALRSIHEHNMTHGDVKAANVLFFDDETVRLSDFGLATMSVMRSSGTSGSAASSSTAGMDSSTTSSSKQQQVSQQQLESSGSNCSAGTPVGGHGLGSAYWMAPELVKEATLEHTPFTPASDIWALGCLCIEVLTGKPPFSHLTPRGALLKIAELTPSDLPPWPTPASPSSPTALSGISQGGGYSPEASSFVSLCFEMDPHKRPSAAELSLHPWLSDHRMTLKLQEVITYHEVARSSANATPPPSPLSGNDIGSWLELHLFTKGTDESERWLWAGGLQLVVQALPYLTPEQSFAVMRCLSYAAQRCLYDERSAFLHHIGSITELNDLWWAREDLATLCAVSDLGNLYQSCCRAQELTQTEAFLPTHPRLMWYLLYEIRTAEPELSRQCLEAFYRRLVGVDASGDNSSGTLAASIADLAASSTASSPMVLAPDYNGGGFTTSSKVTRARKAVQRRCIKDGGLLILRAIVERQCADALVLETMQPSTSSPLGSPGAVTGAATTAPAAAAAASSTTAGSVTAAGASSTPPTSPLGAANNGSSSGPLTHSWDEVNLLMAMVEVLTPYEEAQEQVWGRRGGHHTATSSGTSAGAGGAWGDAGMLSHSSSEPRCASGSQSASDGGGGGGHGMASSWSSSTLPSPSAPGPPASFLHRAARLSRTTAAANIQWYVSLHEGVIHGCVAAARLLVTYIRLAFANHTIHQSQQETPPVSPDTSTHHHYVVNDSIISSGGGGVGGFSPSSPTATPTFLFPPSRFLLSSPILFAGAALHIASAHGLTPLSALALQQLPSLQGMSDEASAFLRDATGALPLLLLTLRQHASSLVGLVIQQVGDADLNGEPVEDGTDQAHHLGRENTSSSKHKIVDKPSMLQSMVLPKPSSATTADSNTRRDFSHPQPADDGDFDDSSSTILAAIGQLLSDVRVLRTLSLHDPQYLSAVVRCEHTQSVVDRLVSCCEHLSPEGCERHVMIALLLRQEVCSLVTLLKTTSDCSAEAADWMESRIQKMFDREE